MRHSPYPPLLSDINTGQSSYDSAVTRQNDEKTWMETAIDVQPTVVQTVSGVWPFIELVFAYKYSFFPPKTVVNLNSLTDEDRLKPLLPPFQSTTHSVHQYHNNLVFLK